MSGLLLSLSLNYSRNFTKMPREIKTAFCMSSMLSFYLTHTKLYLIRRQYPILSDLEIVSDLISSADSIQYYLQTDQITRCPHMVRSYWIAYSRQRYNFVFGEIGKIIFPGRDSISRPGKIISRPGYWVR